MATGTMNVRCCIAGGGPAGMMAGFLLARAGVEVAVLEKHADFLRDFRGDTVHPSTLDVIAELGLLDDFLKIPHQELREIRGVVGETEVVVADFRHVPTRCKYIAFMPQWDFLSFLAAQARRYPAFRLLMRAEAVDLIREGGRIAGVRANTPEGEIEIRAELVIGADGRHSTVRERAGLEVQDFGAPIDVLWMKLAKRPGDPTQSLGRFNNGHVLVMLDRGDYWQCGFVIPKGGYDALKARGIEALHAGIAAVAPFFADRVAELKSWDDVSLLTVTVDRLKRWHLPGLLCIGDAAHAMSPIGGVGINLAIQDAVAAANMLYAPLRAGTLTEADLGAVQKRRGFPAKVTQAIQVFIQNRIFPSVSAAAQAAEQRAPKQAAPATPPPLPVRIMRAFPILRRIPARIVGVGVRPEHVRTPEAPAAPR